MYIYIAGSDPPDIPIAGLPKSSTSSKAEKGSSSRTNPGGGMF